MTPERFRKLPVEIDAIRWNGDNLAEVMNFLGSDLVGTDFSTKAWTLMIRTLEGTMLCPQGHWVIRGVKGEHYACAPDVFAQTYERAE